MDQSLGCGVWHKSTVQAVEMSCRTGACGVTIRSDESNEGVYWRCSMVMCANVMCGVVQWVKRKTLRCFAPMEGMKSRMYMNSVFEQDLGSRRGRQVTWKMER